MSDIPMDKSVEEMDGAEWAALLAGNPRFAEKCDWRKLDGADWVSLLKVRPEFAEKCDWDKLEYRGFGLGGCMEWWVELLSERPEFADKCDFSKFDDYEWRDLICAQSTLADKCDILGLRGSCLGEILHAVPELAKKIDLQKLDGNQWCEVLSSCPELSDQCDWRRLDWKEVEEITSVHPELWRRQEWKPDVFVGYSDDGRSIATSVRDKLYNDWFLTISGNPKNRIEEINGYRVFVPILTADFDLSLLEQIKIPIVPLWPNNESNRVVLSNGCEVSTLDMTGTDFERSIVKVGCRFPKDLLNKREDVANYATRREWAKLVCDYPEYLYGAKRVELDASGWVDVLGSRPELEFGCDWMSLDASNWQVLLCRQPQFADRCKWSLFDHESWKCLLRWQPQFSDKCSFSDFTGDDWQELLELQPQLAGRCDWTSLDGKNWAWLLRKQPQFADECDWDKIKKADPDDVCYLLERQPQFVNQCNTSRFSGRNWRDLINAQNILADYCDWAKLNPSDLCKILCKRPELGEKVEWPEFTGEQWSMLLSVQPQFADRCNWASLNGEDWQRLLEHQPQFGGNCEWPKLSGWDWAWLLISRPEFESFCEWGKLSGKDWVKLLSEQPDFSTHCNWSVLSENDWKMLLNERPQFAEFHVLKKKNDDCSYYDVYLCLDPTKTKVIAERFAVALEKRGFGVYKNNRGVFDEEARSALEVSKHFVLIRSEDLYAHLDAADDPIAKQMKTALDVGVDIVFVGPSDQKWQDVRQLPPELATLQTQQVKILDVGDMFEVKVDAIVRECFHDQPGSLSRKFDVFISYRRSTGAKFARKMQQGLKGECCTSFLDYDSILNGKYDKVIHAAIDSADVFLMLLTDGSLDRCCTDPEDWVAAEIRAAHKRGMCIVPITPSDQNWQLPNNLPEDMNWLCDIDPIVVEMDEGWFPDSMKKILRCFPKSLLTKRLYVKKVRDEADYDAAERGLTMELPKLLAKYPDSLPIFPYENFSGAVWQQILQQAPGLSYKCDWSLLEDFQIVSVLGEQPQFADKCNWRNLSGFDIQILLEKQPQFADRCDLNLLDACDMASLLCKQPQLAEKCDLSRIDYGGSWATLLGCQPQFADQCDWTLLEGEHWVELLMVQPQFADKCNWSLVDGVDQSELCELVSKQPQFLDKVDWRRFTSEHLSWLLISQPQLIDDCDVVDLDGESWARILVYRPEFAERCDWSKFNDVLWEQLLEYRPELATYRN